MGLWSGNRQRVLGEQGALHEWDYVWECEDCAGGQAGYSTPQEGPGAVVDTL